MARKIVVITGASTGIGQATAEVLAEHGYTVFAGIRKEADGEQYAVNPNIQPLLMDVTDHAAVAAAAETVKNQLQPGDAMVGLVNNAGIAVGGPVSHVPLDGVRLQFEVNVIGLMAVTQAFLPLLQSGTPRGRVVNISSVAGKMASPFLGMYSASKHAVEAISDSLRREQMPFGVKVVIIEPGPIATPIWDKGTDPDAVAARYADSGFGPIIKKFMNYFVGQGRKGLPPSAVASLVFTALESPDPKVRYLITPDPMQFRLSQLLPAKMVDKNIYKQLGMDEIKR